MNTLDVTGETGARTTSRGLPAWAAVFAASATLLVSPALAGTGALTQLAGTDGCVSDGGSSGNCVDAEALDGIQGLTVSNNGLSLYAASDLSDGVVVFLRTGSGALIQQAGTSGCVTDDGSGGACADGRALQGARDVALDKKAKHLYVAAPGDDAIAVFARDKTGTILQLAGTDGCVSDDGTGGECAIGVALDGARSVTVGPKGKFVHATSLHDDAVTVFARDKKTGVLTQLPGTDGCVSEDGTGGLCVNGRALDFPTDVAVSPKGDSLYVAAVGSSAVSIFARDKKTGILSQLVGTAGCISEDGTGGNCTDGRGLAGAFGVTVSKDGKFVYVAARDGNAVAAFARDKSTGALSQLAGTDGCISEDGSGGECADGTNLTGALSVVLSRDGKNAYVASNVSDAVAIFSRDKKTGVLAQFAGTEACISDDGSGGACADGTALVEASSVIVTRNGKSVYVASPTSDAISAFDRD
ncbi:MAG: beta-propeller fold lactonase family protein [Candidatus Binatia bacterium]|nr:beta-propeller fold lactonase family protein [Candidatus Binatia bacterium]